MKNKEFQNLNIYCGNMPSRQIRKAVEWPCIEMLKTQTKSAIYCYCWVAKSEKIKTTFYKVYTNLWENSLLSVSSSCSNASFSSIEDAGEVGLERLFSMEQSLTRSEESSQSSNEESLRTAVSSSPL